MCPIKGEYPGLDGYSMTCSNDRRWTPSLRLLLVFGLLAGLVPAAGFAASEALLLRSEVGVRLEVILPAGPAVEVNDLLGNAHDLTSHQSSGGAPRGRGPNISGSGLTPIRISIRSGGMGGSSNRTALQMPATWSQPSRLLAASAPSGSGRKRTPTTSGPPGGRCSILRSPSSHWASFKIIDNWNASSAASPSPAGIDIRNFCWAQHNMASRISTSYSGEMRRPWTSAFSARFARRRSSVCRSRAATSWSEIVCSLPDDRYIPASAISSPITPMATNTSAKRYRCFRRRRASYVRVSGRMGSSSVSKAISPTSPMPTTAANTISAISELCSHSSASDLVDSENTPISRYDLAVAIALVIQAFVVGIFLLRRAIRRE